MNIEHLREFTYLAETLSFNITAKHFFISQSVLSKHIMALEEDLGVVLFDRDRRHVELTGMGRLFYEDCVTILNDYDRARARLATAGSDRPVTMSVGYLRNAARPFLSPFMRYMERERPDVQLVMTCMEYGELIRAHRSHQVDVLLTLDLDPEAHDMCDFVHVYTDRLYVVVGKGHPLASRREGVTTADLDDGAFAFPRSAAYPGLSEFIERFVPRSHHVGNAHYYGDIDTLYMRLERGDCAAMSSGHNIARSGAQMVFLPLVDADTSYSVGARWFKDADPAMVEAVRAAAEHCREAMAKWDDGFAGQFAG